MTSLPPAFRLTESADAPALAREFVGTHVEQFDARSRDVIQLLVSEIVTNAFLHGKAPIEVSVVVTGATVRIEVHDAGPVFALPAKTDHEPHRIGGWGLAIVATLATSHGVLGGSGTLGKRVWFELDASLPLAEFPDAGPTG